MRVYFYFILFIFRFSSFFILYFFVFCFSFLLFFLYCSTSYIQYTASIDTASILIIKYATARLSVLMYSLCFCVYVNTVHDIWYQSQLYCSNNLCFWYIRTVLYYRMILIDLISWIRSIKLLENEQSHPYMLWSSHQTSSRLTATHPFDMGFGVLQSFILHAIHRISFSPTVMQNGVKVGNWSSFLCWQYVVVYNSKKNEKMSNF